MTQTIITTVSPYRSAGHAAIASGAIGLLGFGFFIAVVVMQPSNPSLMFRFHDTAVIFQFLLMIPVALGLQKLSQKRSSAMSEATLTTGISIICFVVVFLLLIFPKILADILYMFPQGIFGVWLIFVNWRLSGLLSRGLRWFGMVVGFGLALVGTFPILYSIFVDTILLRIPAASTEALDKIPFTPANIFLHQILLIGSFIGVPTLPVWTVLVGRRLFKEKS